MFISTDTLIVGATAVGLALADRLKQHCVVVGNGYSAAAEFADAMATAPIDMTHDFTGLAGEIKAELCERAILSEDGRIHPLAVAGVMARRYLLTGCMLLCGAVLTSVEKTDGGYHCTVFTPEEGYRVYECRRVIDTLVHGFMDCEKTLAVLLQGDGTLTEFTEEKLSLTRGRFADEFVLRFTVGRDDDMPTVQKQVHSWLLQNRARIGQATVATNALEFGYRFVSPVETERDGVCYLPSASYDNVLAAIEGGEKVCL